MRPKQEKGMRRILSTMTLAALGALGVQAAHADGNARFAEEGKVDQDLLRRRVLRQSVSRYSSLELDLTNILKDIGRHSIGIAFSRDTTRTTRSMRLPPAGPP